MYHIQLTQYIKDAKYDFGIPYDHSNEEIQHLHDDKEFMTIFEHNNCKYYVGFYGDFIDIHKDDIMQSCFARLCVYNENEISLLNIEAYNVLEGNGSLMMGFIFHFCAIKNYKSIEGDISPRNELWLIKWYIKHGFSILSDGNEYCFQKNL